MLTKSLVLQTQSPSLFFSSSSPCIFSCTVGCSTSLPITRTRKGLRRSRIRCSSDAEAVQKAIQQSVLSATKSPTTVKAVVTVKATIGGMFSHIGITRGLDDIEDLLGRTLLLELVSNELDEKTGREKKRVEAFAHKGGSKGDEVKYEDTFSVPKGFGQIGGVLVTNEHHKEMYLNDIVLMTGDDETTALTIDCRSWLHSKFDNPEKRIFFTTKSYLPSETPAGLLELRNKELETMRGSGKGQRQKFERIYDYDTYNDLGDPNDKEKARPVLGGTKDLPYPRRCRTGRPKTKKGLGEEIAADSQIDQPLFEDSEAEQYIDQVVDGLGEEIAADSQIDQPLFEDSEAEQYIDQVVDGDLP